MNCLTRPRVILVTYLNWVNSVAYQVPISYVIPLTLCVNSLGCLFQIILTLDAYRIKNHIQVFVQCAANICLSISTVLQYGETRHAVSRILVNHDMYGTPFADVDWPFWKKISPGLMVCTVVTCVSSAIMCLLARGLYREFSWALYQHVSPDKKIQTKYAVYQVRLASSSLPDHTHTSTDIPRASQVYTLLRLRVHNLLRFHRRPFPGARVLIDDLNHPGYSCTCGYRSIFCQA